MACSMLHGGRIFCWNNKKGMLDIFIDSLVIAGIAAFAGLPNTHIPGVDELYTACYAFFTAFLAQVALEKGIKKVKK